MAHRLDFKSCQHESLQSHVINSLGPSKNATRHLTRHDMNAKWRSGKNCTLHDFEICPRINYCIHLFLSFSYHQPCLSICRMLLFIECDHSKRCLSISILQMAATRWLLLAACVVSPCAWCTLTSGHRLSYSKLMHHAAKASFRMFISIWPWVFKPPIHPYKTGELLLSCFNTLDCLVFQRLALGVFCTVGRCDYNDLPFAVA